MSDLPSIREVSDSGSGETVGLFLDGHLPIDVATRALTEYAPDRRGVR